MEIQQLRYIVALSQELNFQKASRRVNVTQPTLSQQVKKLEDELGTSLFERSAHGVKLTEAGSKLIPRAIQILDQISLGISEVQESTSEVTGTVRLGAIPTIAPYLLPTIIMKLRKSNPKIKLEIYEETTSSLVDHLKEGLFDLALLALPIEEASLVSRMIGKEPFYLAVSKNHPLAHRKNVSVATIQKEKLLILHEGHCFADQALEYCKLNREDEEVAFQGSSLTSVMNLAATSTGVTLVPKMAVDQRANPRLEFIPFVSPMPQREIGLLWRVSAPLSRAHKRVMEVAKEAFKEKSVML